MAATRSGSDLQPASCRPVEGSTLAAEGSAVPPGRSDTPTLAAIGYLQDEGRARRLAARVVAGGGDDLLRVSRAVVFLTARCDLRCTYCRSRDHAVPEWSSAALTELLDRLSAAGTQHVQWTGGEATQDERLAALVSRCSAAGIETSVSTNGCAGPERYLALAEAGLGRVYVSLDQLDGATFDRLSGTQGQIERVFAGLAALVEARGRLGRPHVTGNVALDRAQVERLMANGQQALRELLGWLVGSGLDDFKFLPLSTDPAGACFPIPELLEPFQTACRSLVPERFEMFHLRLNTLAHGGHGFRDARPRRCYLALDDRCYDALGAYPCVVQLREGGPRLWRAETSDLQRAAALRRFVAADRSEDPLCRRYCFDLYRRVNTRVAVLLAEHEAGSEALHTAIAAPSGEQT